MDPSTGNNGHGEGKRLPSQGLLRFNKMDLTLLSCDEYYFVFPVQAKVYV